MALSSPHWMSVGALFHGVPMILLSMTSIHGLTISPQNLKNMRIGLRKPTFLSSPGFRAWLEFELQKSEVQRAFAFLGFWGRVQSLIVYLRRVRHRREDRREPLSPFIEASSCFGCFTSIISLSPHENPLKRDVVIMHFTDVEAEVERD